MNNYIVTSMVFCAAILALPVNADLYKGVDSEGNVVYSDQPFDNARKFKPPSLTVVDAPAKKAEVVTEESKPAEFKYSDFDIVSPENSQTLRDTPDIAVSLNLKPALNVAENHSIWLLVNGKPVIRNSRDLSLQIGRLDRGAHQLQAQVRNQDGKILARTRAIMIHVKNTFIPQKAR